MAIPSTQIAKALIEALGLPPELTLLQIRLAINEPVEIICRYYPNERAMAGVAAVLKTDQVVLVDSVELPPGAPQLDTPVMEPVRHRGDEAR